MLRLAQRDPVVVLVIYTSISRYQLILVNLAPSDAQGSSYNSRITCFQIIIVPVTIVYIGIIRKIINLTRNSGLFV